MESRDGKALTKSVDNLTTAVKALTDEVKKANKKTTTNVVNVSVSDAIAEELTGLREKVDEAIANKQ